MTVNNVRAADYRGVEGLYIPPHVTGLVINEMCTNSTLAQMANPNYTPEGLGLDCAEVAVYDVLEQVDEMVFTRGHLNGERVGIASPFRSGQITMCNQYSIKQKFSRDEAIRLCKRWETVQMGYEKAVAAMLVNLTETYGYPKLAASAAPYNVGNDAGRISSAIKLGDAVNPLQVVLRNDEQVTDFNVTALEVVSRMVTVATEANMGCGLPSMEMRASPRFVAKLMQEQSKLGIGGCCIKDNPAVSGVLLDAYGFKCLQTQYFPRKRLADGRTLEYVLLGDPNLIAVPTELDYLEWQTVLNDIYLVGNYRFTAHLMSERGMVVAAVVL